MVHFSKHLSILMSAPQKINNLKLQHSLNTTEVHEIESLIYIYKRNTAHLDKPTVPRTRAGGHFPRESISVLPGHKAIIEKWIQTSVLLSGKIREFLRALFFNRAIDIKKVRNLMADINAKIYFVRKSVWRSKASLAVKKGSLTFTYHNRRLSA